MYNSTALKLIQKQKRINEKLLKSVSLPDYSHYTKAMDSPLYKAALEQKEQINKILEPIRIQQREFSQSAYNRISSQIDISPMATSLRGIRKVVDLYDFKEVNQNLSAALKSFSDSIYLRYSSQLLVLNRSCTTLLESISERDFQSEPVPDDDIDLIASETMSMCEVTYTATASLGPYVSQEEFSAFRGELLEMKEQFQVQLAENNSLRREVQDLEEDLSAANIKFSELENQLQHIKSDSNGDLLNKVFIIINILYMIFALFLQYQSNVEDAEFKEALLNSQQQIVQSVDNMANVLDTHCESRQPDNQKQTSKDDSQE